MRGAFAGHALVAAAVIAACATPSAAARLPVRHFTVVDGLPHNSITALYQDRRGYLWIGTAEGLARFDGYRFVTYGVERGLAHPYITAFTEDSSGRLWVATHGGVSRLRDEWGVDPAQTFVSYTVGETPLQVNGMHAGSDGVLWVATYRGLFRARSDAGEPVTFDRVASFEEAQVLDVFVDAGRRAWVWTLDRGLQRVDDRHPRLAADEIGDPRGRAFVRGQDGRAWLATAAGVFEIDAGPDPSWQRTPVGTTDALSAVAGARGGLWVVTPRGVLRSNGTGGALHPIRHGLSPRLNRVLLVDREGHVWVGSGTDGLYQVIDGPIVSYTAADGLPGPAVDTVFEGPDGRIYARGDGWMAAIDDERVTPLAESGRLAQERWPRRPVIDSRGDWWMLRAQALCRVAGPVPLPGRPASCLASDAPLVVATDSMDVPEMFEDRDGRLWYASPTVLHRVDTARGVVEQTPLQFSRPSRGMMPSLTDATGTVWFLSAEDIGRWIDGRVELLERGDGLPETRPRSILLDRSGRLWIGMRYAGVSMTANPAAARPAFINYSIRDGLSSNAVWSIAEDDAGRIYLGTGRGLDRLDPATGHIRRFTTADGLAGDLINRTIRDRRGHIWVATPAGVSRLDPRIESAPSAPPATRLVRVGVAGEDLRLPERGAEEGAGLRLPASSNSLVVDYAAVSFEGPGALRYQYRLEGTDAGWSVPSDQRSVNYARLAPGAYSLEVRAVRRDGAAGPPARLAFAILPPFWQRPWFVGLIVAGLAAAALVAHRLRVRRLLATARVRRQIAIDLHDDIGAGLVQVAILSEVAKRGEPAVQESHLDEIARLARTMRDSMSDIVWSIDPRKYGFAELVRRMQAAASNALAGDGIRVVFRTPPAQDLDRTHLSPDRGRHVLLILKETVANIARHAGATQVDIGLALSRAELVLTVRDDGRGFDPREAHEGQGLGNLARRAEALGGRLAIDSGVGRGTSVELRVPL